MGLLAVPPILLALRRRREAIDPATAALALILAVNLIDLLPNSGLTPITWLLAGALAGRLEWSPAAAAVPGAAATAAGAGGTGPPAAAPDGAVAARARLPYARPLAGASPDRGRRPSASLARSSARPSARSPARPRGRAGLPFSRDLTPSTGKD
jgi:hypothetical protein